MGDVAKITMPKAVFWDWDGTLVDSYNFLNDAHNHTLISLGFPPFKEGEYRNYFGKPREVLYPAIYKDKCDQAKEIFQKYVLGNSHKVQVLQGAEPVLDMLYKNNIPMGIVSNKKANLIAQELEYLGWSNYFKVIIGAGDAGSDKPSKEPLVLALKKAAINDAYEDIWYIGDTENDLLCAKNIGCKSVFFKDVSAVDKLVDKYSPFISFSNYEQLQEILVAI